MINKIRKFDTGATRDVDENKLDYNGFLSPIALKRFAEYMHKNRLQTDGSMRDSKNWQKGIPQDSYMSSMWRHFFDVWAIYHGIQSGVSFEEALCALMFNVQGMLHEELKKSNERD